MSARMSKSLRRVTRALAEAGLDIAPRELAAGSRTATDAAAALGCRLDQIAKSIVFHGIETDRVALFITAGGNQVDPARASALAGEPLVRATADQIRAQTGFAIGGVSPVGLISAVRCWFDPRLLDFDEIWPAAGTPRHVFSIQPRDLLQISGAKLSDFICKT